MRREVRPLLAEGASHTISLSLTRVAFVTVFPNAQLISNSLVSEVSKKLPETEIEEPPVMRENEGVTVAIVGHVWAVQNPTPQLTSSIHS
jgi:hypothetical protein